MSWRYLSYELADDTPVFGANSPVSITVDADFSTGPYLQHLIETINHNGTHVDVPSHFHPGGLTLSDLPADTWRFSGPTLVDLPVQADTLIGPEHLAPALQGVGRDVECLLLRTGFGAVRDEDPQTYLRANPGFGLEAARYLRAEFGRLRAVFCDIPSYTAFTHMPDGVSWHQEMLRVDEHGGFVLLFEDVHLPADLTAPRELWAVPIRLRDLDGAPVTIIADLP